MKQINFVSPIPKQKKKEVRRWLIITALLALALMLFISISLFACCYHYYLLQSEQTQVMLDHAQCTLVLQTQKEKESANSTRSERLALLQRYQNQPNQIANSLRSCNQKIGDGALQSCSIGKKSFELSYKSATIALAQKTLTDLKGVPGISNLQLVSLQRQTNGVTSTVRAEIS